MSKNIYTLHDRVLCRAIFIFIIINVYFSFGSFLLTPLGISNNIVTYTRFGISVLITLIALKYIKKRVLIYFVLLETFFIASYSYSFFMQNMEIEGVFLYLIYTLMICVPFFAIVASIDNLNCLYEGLLKASFWNIIFLIIYFVFQGNKITYSMPATYQILFCAVLHVNQLFKRGINKKLFYFSLVLLELSIILIKGARGPLACLLIYIFIKLITEIWINNNVKIWAAIAIILAIPSILNLKLLLYRIQIILIRNNIYSRTITQLVNNDIFNDSGRGMLQELAIELIREKPLLGYGAASDVKLLEGTYVHTLHLELILNFGIVMGLIIFLYITFETLRTLFEKNSVQKDLKMIFIALGYLMLMFSSTYLQNIYLFLFYGLVIRSSIFPMKISEEGVHKNE